MLDTLLTLIIILNRKLEALQIAALLFVLEVIDAIEWQLLLFAAYIQIKVEELRDADDWFAHVVYDQLGEYADHCHPPDPDDPETDAAEDVSV